MMKYTNEPIEYKLDEEDEEEYLPTRADKLKRLAIVTISVLALAGLFYLTSLRAIFLFQRTPTQLKQTPIASQLDAAPIDVPLIVYILQGPAGFGSQRTEVEASALVENAARIWQQADINLVLTEIREVELNKSEFELFFNNSREFITISGLQEPSMINVYLVDNLTGINGVSFGGLNTVAVADRTTVFDWRTLAHEVGHVLNLDHIDGSQTRLMYKGANGTDLSLDEITIARQRAEYFIE